MNGRNIVFRWRTTLVAYVIMLSGVAFSDISDMVLRFSTPGIDRYADGSAVVDGECYALVWSPKGSVFSGFNADGSAISSQDRVVLAAPLARGGKCRNALFQIPEEEYAELEGGEWAVCLVDTRTASGIPAGVKDNVPLRVNRWGVVDGGVKIEPASASALTVLPSAAKRASSSASLAAVPPDGSAAAGVCASTVSAVPDSVKPPRITGLDLLENGEVWLEVADTVPFLSYTIISGSKPGNLQEDSCSEVVDGKSGANISIGTAQSSDCRFFKVVRAE